MTISKYPNGFRDGVSIQNMPVLNTYGNKVYWVYYDTTNSTGGADGNPGTFEKPFATLDYAVGLCLASRGDIIMLKPNHNETISTATALALDVAGISIIGLGKGSTRPKFILDTATSTTIAVSAASISIENIIFSANFADVADLFTPTATDFSVVGCKFTQEATDMNFIDIVDTSTSDNESDGLTIIGCEWVEPDVSSASLVNVDADLEGLTVQDCYIDLGINGVLSTIAEVATGKDLTNLDIRRNYSSRLVTASAVQLITFAGSTTTNTGIMESNRCRSLDVAGEIIVTAGTNISFYDNLTTSAIDKSGYILPVIDA
jgi:hypothetical protein